MVRFILLSFGVMGWAFWVLSGGADFVPETRAAPEPAPVVVAKVPAAPAPEPAPAPAQPTPEPARPAPAPEPPAPQPAAAAPQPEPAPEPTPQPAQTPPAQTPPAKPRARPAPPAEAPAPEAAPTPAPAPQVPQNLRSVSAARVNMRAGPSTDFRVLDTLSRGTAVEVLGIDRLGSEPWARLLVLDTGMEGWMAERFLDRP